jgi:hypothetical protein
MTATAAQWEWLAGGDAGLSSATIWSVMTGCRPGRLAGSGPYIPLDSDDLGRCIRLLERFSEWRARLPELVDVHAGWTPIVENWDRLVALYRAEPADHRGWRPKLEAAFRALFANRCCCGSYVLGDGEPGERHERNGCTWRNP